MSLVGNLPAPIIDRPILADNLEALIAERQLAQRALDEYTRLAKEAEVVLASARDNANKITAAAILRVEEAVAVRARTLHDVEVARAELANIIGQTNRVRAKADAYMAEASEKVAKARDMMQRASVISQIASDRMRAVEAREAARS